MSDHAKGEPALSPDQVKAYAILLARLRFPAPLNYLLGDIHLQERLANGLIDLEEAFGIHLDVDEAFACRTVGRLLAFVEALAHPVRAREAFRTDPNVQVFDLVAYRASIGRPIRAERFA